MNIDLELSTWREEWQCESPVPPDLRRRVERESRVMRFMRLCEVLITIVFGGGTAAWAIMSSRRDVCVLAALTWLSIALAWRLSLMKSRGLWSAAAETHADFLNLSIRRCLAQIRATSLSSVLYCFNLIFTMSWVYREQPIRPLGAFLISWPACVVWAVTLVFFGWLVWHRRRKRAELGRLLELQKEMHRSVLN